MSAAPVTSPEIIFIYVTTPGPELAETIAKELLNSKLVACANILPEMKSLYHWEGRLCEDKESVLILKTKADHFEAISRGIKSLHSYDCPCVVALPVNLALTEYRNWILNNTETAKNQEL